MRTKVNCYCRDDRQKKCTAGNSCKYSDHQPAIYSPFWIRSLTKPATKTKSCFLWLLLPRLATKHIDWLVRHDGSRKKYQDNLWHLWKVEKEGKSCALWLMVGAAELSSSPRRHAIWKKIYKNYQLPQISIDRWKALGWPWWKRLVLDFRLSVLMFPYSSRPSSPEGSQLSYSTSANQVVDNLLLPLQRKWSNYKKRWSASMRQASYEEL